MSEVGGQSSKLPYGQQVQAPNPDPVIPMRPDWHHGAPCNGKVGLFYPEGRVGIQIAYAACRAICATCPVLETCRADVLANERPSSREGFRAGMSPQERHVASGTRKGSICQTCGELTALTRRFCSSECRKGQTHPCLICGGDAFARNKYCSLECKRVARRATAAAKATA